MSLDARRRRSLGRLALDAAVALHALLLALSLHLEAEHFIHIFDTYNHTNTVISELRLQARVRLRVRRSNDFVRVVLCAR